MEAKGTVFQYQNSKERGVTWCAEITLIKNGGAMISTYGQKNMKSAMKRVVQMADKLGWELIAPFEKINK
jgi:hypothetical protein